MGYIKQAFKYIKKLNTRGFWVGFITGLFYFAYIFWWLWSLYPLDSFGVTNHIAAFVLIAAIFTLSVVVMSIFWGFFGFFTTKFKRNISPVLLPLTIASTFTLAEFFRSIFFSIFWYGNGGMIGPYWPLGNLAYRFTDVYPVFSTASFWGIYGITFIISYLAISILLIFKGGSRRIFVGQIILIILLITSLNIIELRSSQKNNLPPVSVAIIQTNVPFGGSLDKELLFDDLQKKLSLTEEAAKAIQEGIIIFPEGANLSKSLTQFLDPEGVENYFKNLSPKELLIVDNFKTTIDGNNLTSNSVFISSKDGVIGVYGKRILTMIGEFLPYIIKIPALVISPEFLDWFSVYRQTAIGTGEDIITYQGNRIKILVCSDLLYGPKAGSGNPDFIITTGSYSIWKGSRIAKNQILSAARFRAIEHGKYLILAGNSDQSYIINPAGKVEKTTSPNSYELLTGSIIPNTGRTWYNYVGDWPILLVSAALFGLGIKKKSF